MKKLMIVCALFVMGATTTSLSAKNNVETKVEKNEKVDRDIDCVSYALAIVDFVEWQTGEELSPNDFNAIFNDAETRCEEKAFFSASGE